MSITRRKFLKTGVFAAALAAIPARNILGQDWKERDGNPDEGALASSDPLANYSKASFRAYLNSVFQILTAGGAIEVTLTQIDDLPSARNGEAFSLVFRGGSRQLRSNTYRVSHPALGTFGLFLVPTGADRNGAQGYVATINRLSYADVLANPAPSKSSFAPISTAPTTPSVAPAQTFTPAQTQVVVPLVVGPVFAPETEADPDSDKSSRKRKPSYKEIDQ